MKKQFIAFILLFVLSLTISVASAQDSTQRVRYDGSIVARVQITSPDDLAFMDQISPDMWSHNAGIGPVDYRIPPEMINRLESSGLSYEILIDDLQTLIDAERESIIQDGEYGIAGDDWFENYKSYSQVSDYVDTLVAQYPNLASRFEIGQSIHGRDLFGIKITGPGSGKPGVLFNGCQHAREFVAVMVPMYIADRLLRDYDSDPYVKSLVDRLEFYIIPIVNPDGFEYAWNTDRMWRKNRRESWGVDLNRNWGYNWGGGGSSGYKWDETYRGTSAFSEPETANMRDFILAQGNIDSHIDFHNYSQLILQPWGCCSGYPPDHSLYEQLGSEMVDLIYDVHHKNYDHGRTYYILYQASGIAPDWTYAETGALGITIELRDTGWYGFLLPASQILPNSEEIFPAALRYAEEVAPPDVRMQLDVDPLYRGQDAEMRASGAESNTMVYFVYSLAGEGSTYVPSLDVTLELDQPKLAGQDESDGSGYAAFTATVPSGAPTVVIWIQAAHYQRLSNVVVTQIN